MKGLSKEKKQYIILIAIMTVGFVGMVYTFLIGAQKEAIAAAEKAAGKAIDNLDYGELLLRFAPKFEEEVDEVGKVVESIEQDMASGDLYSWFILNFNNFRIPYNISNPTFERELKVKAGIFPNFPYDAVQFTVSGNAFYHDLGRFIADFENKYPYMRIQNVQMTPGMLLNPNEREKLTFKLEVVTLLKPLASEKEKTQK